MSIPVEFGSLPDANAAREDHAEYVCPVDDDRRHKTVHFVSDTPESVLDRIRAAADEGRAGREATTGQATLTDAERDRIDFSKGKANVPWARSIKALADEFGVSDWTAYVDPTLSVSEHRQVMREAGQEGGGARDDGDQRDAAREAAAAATEQEEGCNHARGYCENGDEEACEFLKTACGYSDDEVRDLLTTTDGGTVDDDGRIGGKAGGALAQLWGGYKGGVSEFTEALERAAEAWEDAQQAAKGINDIRENFGQEPIHFDALEAGQANLLDLLRHAAADCHECHADHSDHDHDTDSGDTEDIREVVRDGATGTPVGTSDDTDDALAAVDAQTLRDRAPDRPTYEGDRDPQSETGLRRRRMARGAQDIRALAAADDARDTRERVEQEQQFAAEKQGTLDAGTEATETAEEKQVTLTGEDEGASSAALPANWKGSGVRYVAGPYEVTVTGGGRSGGRSYHGVVLTDEEGNRFDVATNLRSADRAQAIAAEFTERVAPDDVSFHSEDAAIQEAAAEAKRAIANDDGGLSEFGA